MIENNSIIIGARNNAISAEVDRIGEFSLAYNGDYTPPNCLSIYRDRDSIGKVFRTLNTKLDTIPLRKKKKHTIHGIIFGFFLSLIIRNSLMGGADIIRSYEVIFLGEDASGT